MAILDYNDHIWRQALGFPEGQEPDALILEGTWWREQATHNRLAHLDNVRELPFPEMYVGEWRGANIVYCCAYGAARAVEPAHVFAQIGTPLLIQIGTCGTLDVKAETGLVILPQECAARDGVSQSYGAGEDVATSAIWVQRAERELTAKDIKSRKARHLTWPSLFAQSDEMCERWTKEGLVSIDMETSAVVAVADHFGVEAVSMLTVWDALPHGRTFLDPLDADAAAALKRSNEVVFEVALSLAEEVAQAKAS